MCGASRPARARCLRHARNATRHHRGAATAGAVKRAKKLPDSPPTGTVLHHGGRAASKWRGGPNVDHIARRRLDSQTTHTIQAECRKCRSVT
jgi:hypothetical protein